MRKELISIDEEITVDTEVKTEEIKNKYAERGKKKMIFTLVTYLVIVPLVIFLGVKLFKRENYNILSMAVAVFACIPFFFSFEKGKERARELVVIAVMTAISVVGRLIFQPLPAFKPVTAIVIITAIAFGFQAGFITGAMSAIVSNIFFGQGPWTPFQMFAWGFLGLITGIVFYKQKKPNKIALILVGILGGIMFSFIMDIFTVLNMDGGWNFSRYLGVLATSVEFTVIYAVSNVIFLLLLTNPFLEKLNRLKNKYGLFKY